tara:strand:- start:1322 stop:2191 length:870 start_codon:yes stop_codon:yes gene_type:complete
VISLTSLTLAGLEFDKVKSGSVLIGENKGGWIYASQRPRHEVKCPDFYIMQSPLNDEQIMMISKEIGLEQKSDSWSAKKLNLILAYLSEKLNDNLEHLDDEKDWEIRCPSQGEWYLSLKNDKILTTKKSRELLSDGTSSNHRGAMMDGRPRQFEGFGPMQYHRAAIETHPSKKEITALSSIPLDRENTGITVRFVVSPIRRGDIVRVPANADVLSNIRVELFWTLVLGIIPSFAIPILRGMGSYAIDGWANLLFGGLCAGFVSGAFWRPKRPTILYEDGEIITITNRHR